MTQVMNENGEELMNNLHQLASNLHLLLCDKEHDSDPNGADPNKCYWYIERQMEERWEQEDSKPWLDIAKEIGEVKLGAMLKMFEIKREIADFFLFHPMLEGILKRAISPLVK